MSIIKKEVLESITRVLENISPEQGEYSYSTDMSPLDAYMSKLIKVNKFKNRSSVYDHLNKIAIKGDKGVIEQYATETYHDIAGDCEDSIHDVITSVTDYDKNELAYTRQILSASKILGLMRLGGKSLVDFEEDGENFLDKSVWNKMSSEDLANFPQFINDFIPFDAIKKRFDTKFMNKIVGLIEDNDDSKDEILDLMVMADIGMQMISMFKSMSEISNKNSTLRADSDLAMPDEDDEDQEFDDDFFDDMEDELSKKLKGSILNLKSREADEAAADIVNKLDKIRTSNKHLENFKMLVKGKHLALRKDKDAVILRAAEIIAFYINDDLNKDDKIKVTEALLPLAYVMALDVPLDGCTMSDLIDIHYIDEFIDVDQDYDYNPRDYRDDFSDITLDTAIELDYAIGSNVTTFYFGVHKDQEFVKALAKKTVLAMSYEYFEDRNKKNYNDSVNSKSIADILSGDYKEFKDESDLIHAAAQAIYSAIND